MEEWFKSPLNRLISRRLEPVLRKKKESPVYPMLAAQILAAGLVLDPAHTEVGPPSDPAQSLVADPRPIPRRDDLRVVRDRIPILKLNTP